jgi:competence protein ComEA
MKQIKKLRYRLKGGVNEWFEMSPKLRKGVNGLLLLNIGMIVFNFISPLLFKAETSDPSTLDEELAQWYARHQAEEKDAPKRLDNAALLLETDKSASITYFKFNPNTASDEDLLKLGFKKGQIESIRKYLSKAGSFKSKQDFFKMYFMDDERIAALHSYVDLPERRNENSTKSYEQFTSSNSSSSEQTQTKKKFDYSNIVVEINSADTTELKKIRGIGSFTAKNIVRFRENLGGFTSVDQLAEVYPLNASKLDSLRHHFIADPGLMQKINLNEASSEQLSRHPYLTSAQAKSLIAYRNMHGNFTSVEGIRKSALIDENTYEKVKHYLRVD